MAKIEMAFDNYIKNYDKRKKEIRYKYIHSYEVQKLMEELSDKLKLSKEDKELASSIGLLHDIGRFEQIKKYKVCSDIKSKTDHANESSLFLFDKGHIRDFIEDNKNDEIIKDAIKNHNKFEISEEVTGRNLFFAKMIRDMDKVDIYRVMCKEHPSILTFDKNEIDSEILNDFNNHKPIRIKENQRKSNPILVQLAFIYDINFKESIEILQKTKYLDMYINKIRCKKNSIEEFNRIKKEIYEYLDKKKELI